MVLLSEVSSLKVPALRAELKARGLQAYGRKQAMIDRLMEHLKASESDKVNDTGSSTTVSAKSDEVGEKRAANVSKESVPPMAAEPLKDLLANVTRTFSSKSTSDESRQPSPTKHPSVPIGLPPPPASMLSGLPPPPASMLNLKDRSQEPSPKPPKHVPPPAPPGMNPERAAMLNRNLQREEELSRRSDKGSFEGRRERSRDKRRTRSSTPRRKRSSTPVSRKRKHSPTRKRSPSPARRTPHSGGRNRGSTTDAFGRSDKTRAPDSRNTRTKRSPSKDSGDKRRREGKRRRDDRNRREDDRKRRRSRRSRSPLREQRRREATPVPKKMEHDNESSTSLSRPRTPSPENVHVPKSKHRSTESLFMTGFKRPLRTKQLLKDITAYGKVLSFWMNPIKTHCYVTFADQDCAKRCRESMYGRLYPDDMPKQFAGRLTIEYCSNVLVAEKAGGGEVVVKTKSIAPPDEPFGINQLLERVERQSVERGRRKGGQVDILFRKTRSRPHIYWLPLTKDELARKEEKKKQQHLELERTVTDAQASTGDRKERRERDQGEKRRGDRRRRESGTRERRSHRERDEVRDKKGSRKD